VKIHLRVEAAAPLTRKTPPQEPVTGRSLASQQVADSKLVQEARKAWLVCASKLGKLFKQAKVTNHQGQAWVVKQLARGGSSALGIDRTTFEDHVKAAEMKLRPGGNLDLAHGILERGLIEMSVYPLTDEQYDRVIGPRAPRGRSVKLANRTKIEVAEK